MNEKTDVRGAEPVYLRRRRREQLFGLLIVLLLVLGAVLHFANLKSTEGPENLDNLPNLGEVPSPKHFEPGKGP